MSRLCGYVAVRMHNHLDEEVNAMKRFDVIQTFLNQLGTFYKDNCTQGCFRYISVFMLYIRLMLMVNVSETLLISLLIQNSREYCSSFDVAVSKQDSSRYNVFNCFWTTSTLVSSATPYAASLPLIFVWPSHGQSFLIAFFHVSSARRSVLRLAKPEFRREKTPTTKSSLSLLGTSRQPSCTALSPALMIKGKFQHVSQFYERSIHGFVHKNYFIYIGSFTSLSIFVHFRSY
jgi:hypothetical protein